MTLLISILAILTFSPIISGLENTLRTTDMPDICMNGSLNLFIAERITLQKGFIRSPFLGCIKITAPRIEIAEGSFDSVPNLMYLDLAQYEIDSSDLFSFGDLPNVRVLKIRTNNQHSYYNTKETMVRHVYHSLKYLDLSNNRISIIRNLQDHPFPNLTHLDLSGNRIGQKTFDFLPKTLLHLDLSGNELSSPRLNGTRNLLSLRLDSNNIKEISDDGVRFTGLEKLVNLSIANNRISRISEEGFESTPNLRYLNLTDNKLSSTNLNVISYLPSLETLILDRNSFVNVPFTGSSNLTKLSLVRNRIAYLTVNSFFGLPYLKRLHLSGNMIESVHVDTFQNQILLEELHLDGNLLSYLPANWCQHTENLRYLNLAGNEFASLKSVIYSPTLPMLQLHLEGNPIVYMNSSIAQMIPEYMIVYLNFLSNGTADKSKSDELSPSESPIEYPSWISSSYSWGE